MCYSLFFSFLGLAKFRPGSLFIPWLWLGLGSVAAFWLWFCLSLLFGFLGLFGLFFSFGLVLFLLWLGCVWVLVQFLSVWFC